MLRDMTLNWCHNYMSIFFNCILSEPIQAFCKRHWKSQNDEQTYIELKNMKKEETEWVEVNYEQIQKLVHGLQIPTVDNFLTTMFRMGL